MNKTDLIAYINKIKPFLNLKAVCDDYNSKTNNIIDYNNLRAVLNGVSKTRLSEDRLKSFIEYMYKDLFINTFDVYKLKNEQKNRRINEIVNHYINQMEKAIIKEFRDDI